MDRPAPAYVTRADGDDIDVVPSDRPQQAALHALGFRGAPGGTLTLKISDDTARARMLSHLRDLGVAFSAGREWSPAEVFEHLRGNGLLHGTYTRIVWTAPRQYSLSQE